MGLRSLPSRTLFPRNANCGPRSLRHARLVARTDPPELGKLHDLAGDREPARAEYVEALRLCRQDQDALCIQETQALMKTAYR
jgi:hypothetical protein